MTFIVLLVSCKSCYSCAIAVNLFKQYHFYSHHCPWQTGVWMTVPVSTLHQWEKNGNTSWKVDRSVGCSTQRELRVHDLSLIQAKVIDFQKFKFWDIISASWAFGGLIDVLRPATTVAVSQPHHHPDYRLLLYFILKYIWGNFCANTWLTNWNL